MPTREMNRIPLLDLKAQHGPLAEALHAAASRVLTSGQMILGPEVASFERELADALGVSEVVGVSSGTDALLALLMASGVGPGDSVVTTPYSFISTAEAIVRLGARPSFADIVPDTMNLDATAAAALVGPHTKAALVVHLFGRPAAVEPLRSACAAAGVPLLDDAAQSIGAVGSATGRAAAISFFPSKNLGGFGDGGAVATNDRELAGVLRTLRNHGASEKLHHARVGADFGWTSFRPLLRVKLPHLPRWTAERRRMARRYFDLLGGLPFALPPDENSVWNQFVIRVAAERRSSLRRHLDDRGIASGVYYPAPLHLQRALAFLEHQPGDFPNAERAAAESLALPIFPGLTDEDLARVAAALADFYR